jgi:RimJ/RimL family protein N-acetyltransferase
MAVADAEELIALLPQTHTESDGLKYLPGEFKMTVEQERDFICQRLDNPKMVGFAAVVEERIAALAGAWTQDFRRLAHHAELGVTVVKEFWGLGLGRKMMEVVLDWGARRGLRKMYLQVFDHNDRAIRLYRNMGFVEEGRLREDILRGDGTYGDTIVMARYY